MTLTSYDYYGVVPATAKAWQKRPRTAAGMMRSRWRRNTHLWRTTATPTNILLSPSTVDHTAAVNAIVGTLVTSASGGTGEQYAYTLTGTAGGKYKLGGTNNAQVLVAGALTAGSDSITVNAIGQSSGKIFNKVIPITVT